MSGIRRVFRILCTIILFVSPTAALAEETASELDIVYAEHAPLAAHSMMLDVVKSGDRLIAAGERGHIILSDDDGNSWRQAETVPTRATLTTLLAVSGRLYAAGHDSVILTSGDNGNTWTQQYFDAERQQPIMDLYFQDSNNGIAIGAYGLMMLTSDGGQSWDDWAVNDEDDAHLNAIIALPDGNLLIAGEAGFSYRSVDGGQSWESLEMPYSGSMFGAVTDGASCVLFYGLRGHVMRSCDDGDSWEELTTDSEVTLLGAAVQPDGKVLLVGNSGSMLVYEQAAGFAPQVHSSGVDFAAVLNLGPGKFLLAGEDGIYFYPEESLGKAEP